jgi:hypothetical protein
MAPRFCYIYVAQASETDGWTFAVDAAALEHRRRERGSFRGADQETDMDGRGLTRIAVALVVVGIATLIPVIGTFILGPLLALVLGGVLADGALRQAAGRVIESAVLAGVETGLGALIGTVFAVVTLVLGLGLNLDPGEGWLPISAGSPEVLLGALNFALAVLGGLIVGLVNALSDGPNTGPATP